MIAVMSFLAFFLLSIPLAQAESAYYNTIPDSVHSKLEELHGQQRADELLNMARAHLGRDPNLCRQYLLEAIDYSEEIGYHKGLARAFNGMGSVHCMMGENIPGLEYFQKALDQYKSVDDTAGQAKALQNISTIQATMGLFEEALITSKKALDLRIKQGGKTEIAKSLSSLAINYRDVGKLEEALKSGNQCVQLKKDLGDEAGMAVCLSTVGTIQSGLGMHNEALKSHLDAIGITRRLGDIYYLGTVLCNLGAAYLEVKEWDLAITSAQEGLEKGEQLGILIIQENAHTVLARAYEEKNQTDLALKHLHQSKKLKDQVYSDEMSQRISTLTSQFENARNRNRLLELEKDQIVAQLELEEKQNQRDLFLVGFAISLPLAILTFVLFRKSVAANQALVIKASELADAMQKMKTLRGLIPICASCKSIRDDKGYWHQVEAYVAHHSQAEFSHGICPECKEIHYGDLFNEQK